MTGRSKLGLVALFMIGCGGSSDAEPQESTRPVVADALPAPVHPPRPTHAEPPRSLVIGDVGELAAHPDLSYLRSLDLALSVADVTERSGAPPAEGSAPASRCDGLDLVRLAERAPQLEELRISGCQSAVQAGLSAFAPRLRVLELADLTLDSITLARLAQLERLEALTLTRVVPGADKLDYLGRALPLRSITLRELQTDSVVSDLLGDFPALRSARIEGAWAGHRAMVSLSKAKRLEELVLVDTNVSNFALNQIRGLSNLRAVDWTGSALNDNSPLYLRELPIERFRCACPNFGDVGLRHLGYLRELQTLDLPRSSVTSAGLAHLADLERLRDLSIMHRAVDGPGFAALAEIDSLRRLRMGATMLEDPRALNLGSLVWLEELAITFENFGDEGAAQLATLTRLRALDLGGTSISDAGLRHLAKLHELRMLELHHTRITNRGLAHLAGLEALEVLELDHTDLVDDGVSYLAGLTKLRELRLDHTLITDRALTSLAGLVALERLNLEGTVVTAEGTQKLGSLPALSAVNLAQTRAQPDQPADAVTR